MRNVEARKFFTAGKDYIYFQKDRKPSTLAGQLFLILSWVVFSIVMRLQYKP